MSSSASSNLKRVFFEGNFFALWLGQIISQFGERLSQMALLGLLYEGTQLSASHTSNLLFFMILPVFVFNPLVGVCVDRFDRKSILLYSDFLRAIVVALIPLSIAIWPTDGPMGFSIVYALVFVLFSLTRFFVPAKSAIIPEIVRDEDLRIANSISATSKMIATFIGALCGGLIVKFWGTTVCFAIDALSFAFSGVMILFLKRKRSSHQKLERAESLKHALARVKSELSQGFSELFGNDHVRFLLKLLCLLMAAGGVVFVSFPVFLSEQFSVGPDGLGFMVSALGLGLFLGAIVMSHFGNKGSHKLLMSLSVLSVSLLFVILANLQHFQLALAVMFCLGLCALPMAVCMETVVQEMVEDHKIGRVYSALEMVIHAVFLLAMQLAGFCVPPGKSGWAFSLMGMASALSVLWLFSREKAAR